MPAPTVTRMHCGVSACVHDLSLLRAFSAEQERGMWLDQLARRAWDLGTLGRALFLLMIFLEKTLRDWKVTLDPMADRKPVQLKVASEAEARATPAPTTSVISCWA